MAILSDRSNRVLQVAAEQARSRRSLIGPEHVLLGIVLEGGGVGVAVLKNLNVDLDWLRQELESMCPIGNVEDEALVGASLDDHPAISAAERAAADFANPYIGTESLLLGLLEDPNAQVAHLLGHVGVTAEEVTSALKPILGG